MSILFGALIGIAYAVAPGPQNFATIRRTLISGVSNGVLLQLGALVGGLPYAVLTLAGVSQLVSHSLIHIALGLTGAAVLVFLGWSTLRDECRCIEWAAVRFGRLRPGRGDRATGAAPAIMSMSMHRVPASAAQQSFWTGAVISICNPLAIAFWLTLDGAMTQPPHRDPMLVLTGFYLIQLGWAVLLPLLIAWRHSSAKDRLVHALSLLCGLAQVGFGLHVGYAALLG